MPFVMRADSDPRELQVLAARVHANWDHIALPARRLTQKSVVHPELSMTSWVQVPYRNAYHARQDFNVQTLLAGP